MIKYSCDSNDETNFPYKVLLTNTQALKICKVFVNDWSANIKFSKTHLSKTAKLGGLLRCYFNFLNDSFETTSDDINKVQNLIKKVLDDKINMTVNLLKEF